MNDGIPAIHHVSAYASSDITLLEELCHDKAKGRKTMVERTHNQLLMVRLATTAASLVRDISSSGSW